MTVPVRLLLVLVMSWGFVGVGVWYLRRSLRTGVVLAEPRGYWLRHYVHRRDDAAGYWFWIAMWTCMIAMMTAVAIFFTTMIAAALSAGCRTATTFSCLGASILAGRATHAAHQC